MTEIFDNNKNAFIFCLAYLHNQRALELALIGGQ